MNTTWAARRGTGQRSKSPPSPQPPPVLDAAESISASLIGALLQNLELLDDVQTDGAATRNKEGLTEGTHDDPAGRRAETSPLEERDETERRAPALGEETTSARPRDDLHASTEAEGRTIHDSSTNEPTQAERQESTRTEQGQALSIEVEEGILGSDAPKGDLHALTESVQGTSKHAVSPADTQLALLQLLTKQMNCEHTLARRYKKAWSSPGEKETGNANEELKELTDETMLKMPAEKHTDAETKQGPALVLGEGMIDDRPYDGLPVHVTPAGDTTPVERHADAEEAHADADNEQAPSFALRRDTTDAPEGDLRALTGQKDAGATLMEKCKNRHADAETSQTPSCEPDYCTSAAREKHVLAQSSLASAEAALVQEQARRQQLQEAHGLLREGGGDELEQSLAQAREEHMRVQSSLASAEAALAQEQTRHQQLQEAHGLLRGRVCELEQSLAQAREQHVRACQREILLQKHFDALSIGVLEEGNIHTLQHAGLQAHVQSLRDKCNHLNSELPTFLQQEVEVERSSDKALHVANPVEITFEGLEKQFWTAESQAKKLQLGRVRQSYRRMTTLKLGTWFDTWHWHCCAFGPAESKHHTPERHAPANVEALHAALEITHDKMLGAQARAHQLDEELRALKLANEIMEREQELRDREVKETRLRQVVGRLMRMCVAKAFETWSYVILTHAVLESIQPQGSPYGGTAHSAASSARASAELPWPMSPAVLALYDEQDAIERETPAQACTVVSMPAELRTIMAEHQVIHNNLNLGTKILGLQPES